MHSFLFLCGTKAYPLHQFYFPYKIISIRTMGRKRDSDGRSKSSLPTSTRGALKVHATGCFLIVETNGLIDEMQDIAAPQVVS